MPERALTVDEEEEVLRAELMRQKKIIKALMNRAERSTSPEGSDFGLFQTTVMLGEQVRQRTEELEAALRDNEKITRELHEAQSELLGAARRAGMAEIANNVLHNIGNVLNSVNVSAELVNNRMRDSKALGLAKAVQLINQHTTDLADFFTLDPKGKRLPEYLNKLVLALAAEQGGITAELRSLTKSIDHIKDILTTQQSYAGTSSVAEDVQIRDLVDDALRMNAEALARHQVSVIKEYADVPSLLLDKHLVLQILLNLIANAKQALESVVGRTRKLTLRVDIADVIEGRRLRIRVEDNGEGIAAENLPRLFAHGFTTRRKGHGFGLHSCALGADELGGTLAAYSDGPDTGAVFTLALPLNVVAN